MPVFRLSDKISFPPPHLAEPEGLLAIGGDLSENRLLLAYKMGIFPWYSKGEPILWWSPDPRLILYPEGINISKRLRRTINQGIFEITSDTAFEQVITSCAQVRSTENKETWIIDEMIESYCRLFESGYAHSIEAWYNGNLAGGIYGISLGGCFFGESMFSRVNNASKVALVALCDYLTSLSFDMIDCQVKTDHMLRMGAVEMSRNQFIKKLTQSMRRKTFKGKWKIASKENLI
jgi:leucyl/phenylalanyl-tRNA--protein transferase